MTVKEQFGKVADNWLLIVFLLVVIIIVGAINPITSSFSSNRSYDSIQSMESNFGYASSKSIAGTSGYYPSSNDDFAPGVTDRKITKNANLATEVEKGGFASADAKLKNIVSMTNSYLLSENSYKNSYDNGKREYFNGQYTIKVDSKKYAQIASELKAIGNIKSFSESSDDITGVYTDLQTELAAEKAKLERYNNLYATTQSTQEKIDLVDRIFNQERTVKYLEDAIKNQDNRVDYSTISVQINEKQSDYVNIAFVKLSNLVRTLVSSFNSLLYILFAALPYAVLGGIVWFIVWLFRRKANNAQN
jgi:hypothetical protein